ESTAEDDRVLSSEVRDVFKNGWTASKKGDSITFGFKGSELAVMYRKSVKKPAPIAYAVIDEDHDNRIMLDANFDEDWGDKAFMATLMYHGRICKDGRFPARGDDAQGYTPRGNTAQADTAGGEDNVQGDTVLQNAVREDTAQGVTVPRDTVREDISRDVPESGTEDHTLTITIDDADDCASGFYLINVACEGIVRLPE
ncbi:MAG: hypothetical protein K6F34_09645, partial [Lachnospiraceae bacterium]|nr:hypothetical protein [Lachnospiraceae bacterium]